MKHVHTIVTSWHAQILDELAKKHGTRRRALELALESLRSSGENLEIPEEQVPYIKSSAFMEEKAMEQTTADVIKYTKMIRELLGMNVVVLPRAVVNSLLYRDSDEDFHRVCQQNAKTFAETFRSMFNDLEPSWESFVKTMKIISNYNILKNIQIIDEDKGVLLCHLTDVDVLPANMWSEFVKNWHRTFLGELGYKVDMEILDRRCIITLENIIEKGRDTDAAEEPFIDAIAKERELTRFFDELFYSKA
ncbi:MAG: hypothetical protein QMC77_07370 [Methanocellales archaeon]|nr:hypothetical protein [Methanocellales archaeon]